MGLFDKIKSGMRRTREVFSGRMDELVENYKELDDDFYEDLTDILIMADVGMETSEMAVSR
ncbi:MAG: signal recognition particle receptor subunit alpha, partial [Clostridia bacterium]|nr:signal recognition particle receptor subunit alpha [Clostridia bacterium]